jgi:hypothetical protein
MFNTSYPFKILQRKKIHGEPNCVQQRFSFRCKSNLRHFVLVDEFDFNFFGIKFYPASLEHSSKKYNALTGNNDAAIKINTCLEIMRYILNERNELASFGFTGALLEDEEKGVPSKRFRLYKRIMEVFFSPNNFIHYALPESSAYFLINRKVENSQQLLETITEMIQAHYEL